MSDLVEVDARRHGGEHLVAAAGQDLVGEPGTREREVDHAQLPQRRGKAPIVAELLGQLDGVAISLLRTVDVDLADGRAERLADRRSQKRLTELEASAQLGGCDPPGRLPGRGRDSPARPRRPRRGSSAAPRRAEAGRRARPADRAWLRRAPPARSGCRDARRSDAGPRTRRRVW